MRGSLLHGLRRLTMMQLLRDLRVTEWGFRERFAVRHSWTIHVRFGSLADIEDCPTDVRFTPKSRHRNSVVECPLCAKSGHSALQ